MKPVQFESKSYNDFVNWAIEDKNIFSRIIELIKDIDRNGLNKGKGKPEPLKHELSGYWSRRITEEQRIVYKIVDGVIIIAQCKGHYKN
jgi:toxin YoeB